MKKTNILYWTFTGIFAALMMLAAYPDLMITPERVVLISQLGYPKYLIPFLGVAKTLGVIAILVPGFPRIKEWAYAGLFFDLVGATYSGICSGGFQMAMLFMLVWFGFGALSYIYYHRRQQEMQLPAVG